MIVNNYQLKSLPVESIKFVCFSCGSLLGRSKAIEPMFWSMGECDVCNKEVAVSKVENFGGIDEIKLYTL